MWTDAKLLFEYNLHTISLLVKCVELPYYACLRWKIERELKIKSENLIIDPKLPLIMNAW